MQKTVFWIGVAVLVVGIGLFYYGYTTIQNIYAAYPYLLSYHLATDSQLKQRWDIAQMLQPIGLGMLALGAIILAYGTFVKK